MGAAKARRESRAKRNAQAELRAHVKLGPISGEFAQVRLGDARRTKRLQKIAEAMAAAPSESFPAMAGDSAALEALYRFTNNKKAPPTHQVLFEPHIERVKERARGCETVLAIHDGSDLAYPYDGVLRTGFGRLGQQQGIQAVMSLAVAFCESGDSLVRNDDHEPLGVIGCQTWAGVRHRVKNTRKKAIPKTPSKRSGTRWGRITSDEWHNSIVASRAALGASAALIHVIDREADAIELYARLQFDGERFVFRVMRNRNVALPGAEDEFTKITEVAGRFPTLFEESIHVAKRGYISPHQRNPPRAARTAKLTYSAGQIVIKKSWELGNDQSIPTFVTLNLVHVKEVEGPKGEEPIEWFLVTSEPIDTEADVRRVVRIYRARWLIEEFFRVLKTGCALEKRQVESRQALESILAISAVVSWRVLLLRHKARCQPEAPATVVLTGVEIDLLQKTRGLSKRPTVQEALLAIAALGGHLKSNGPPGPIVLVRGLEKLEAQAEVWEFAMAEATRRRSVEQRRRRDRRCDR